MSEVWSTGGEGTHDLRDGTAGDQSLVEGIWSAAAHVSDQGPAEFPCEVDASARSLAATAWADAESEHARTDELRFLADVATSLWRLGRRLLDPAIASTGALAMARRHFQAAWDALDSGGVSVQDHTGETFDPGLALRVVAFETAAVDGERVIETIRPSVSWRGQLMQMGEVIVGTPEETSAVPAPNGNEVVDG